MPAPRARSLRKSQTTTPHDTPNDAHSPAPDMPKEKKQSFLPDLWSEPPPKAPQPSYEEHGFARHGVVENMAPLGVPPSAKVKQRVHLMQPVAALRRGGVRSLGSLAPAQDSVDTTPEMTPAPETTPAPVPASALDDDDDALPPAPPDEDDDDDDYRPAKKAKTQPQPAPPAPTPSVRGTPAQKNPFSHIQTPSRKDLVESSPVPASSAPLSAFSFPGDSAAAADQRLQTVINEAILRSRADNRPNIGIAIQRFHARAAEDALLRGALEAILRQNPTDQQFQMFRRFIKNAKKQIKREQRARVAQAQRGASSDYSTSMHFPSSPISAKASDAASSPAPSEGPGVTGQPHAPNLDMQSSDPSDIQMEDAPPSEANFSAPLEFTPHPLASVPPLAKRSPSPGPTRMPSKSPRKQETVNGSKTVEPKTEASSKAPSPVARAMTSESNMAAGSDSDLSDVNEEIVQNGPPEPLGTNGTKPATALPVKKAKPAASGRGKKSRANSAKPLPARYEKRAPPTAEELAEEAEIRKRREEMARQQVARRDYNPPTSDIRFDDDLLETESLTESMIAVGPPGSAYQQQRAEEHRRTSNGKRPRDGYSARPSSVATTRPTTPAIAAPSKRLKLNNGQIARTKRSPIKNRDGPIAGVPHVSGGSRHSGPDDNDPGSPPSESDDFCSACKGAGEFVCCDGCTRVYHYLCCDPPTHEAPTGSFLCRQCDAKARLTDEPAADTFVLFGPLLKLLDVTNPRSFALSSDIQTYFEDVSARDDGSYFEEMKKFPLSKSSGYGYQRPDYLRTHDDKQKPILCTQCGKSSAGKRQMLKCDYCPAYWHLDCCDPPLANPPPISLEAAHRDAWKCPRHVDHDLRSGLLFQNELYEADDDADVHMSDADSPIRVPCKVRKPRHPSLVEPTFSHGIRNNGLIDIINDADDDTDGEGNYVFSQYDSKDSKIFRVPEKGIIVDFISKVKQNKMQQHRAELLAKRQAAKQAARRRASQQQFAARSLQEQQGALYLAKFANKEQDIGLNEASVNALYLSLTAEAPDAVVDAVSSAETSALTESKRAGLVRLRELIDRALET